MRGAVVQIIAWKVGQSCLLRSDRLFNASRETRFTASGMTLPETSEHEKVQLFVSRWFYTSKLVQ